MPDNHNIADDLREEMAQVESKYLMSPTERRRKLIRWVIRQFFTLILYFFLWDAHPWVPKTLWVVAPLAVLSLASILGFNWFLRRKIRKTEAGIEKLEETLRRMREDAAEQRDPE